VPLWALVQLGSRGAAGAAAGADIAVAMHLEACAKLEALLIVERELQPTDADSKEEEDADTDPSTVPQKVFVALRRCGDADARGHFEELLCRRLGEKQFAKKRSEAATKELLAELRKSLAERRTPDVALAAELLRLGADPSTREGSVDGSDEEDDPWASRESGDDGSLRSALELLALNPHADPAAMAAAVTEVIRLRADPNHGRYGEKPLVLAVRKRNVAAVQALLRGGAELTRQAMVALRRVCGTELRHRLEDCFKEHWRKNKSMSLQDVGLWAAVQSGFKEVACKAIEDGADVGIAVVTALRRCRDADARGVIEASLRQQHGGRWFEGIRAKAATSELIQELREALADRRDPGEALVAELLALGADPRARPRELDDSDVDTDVSEPETSSSSSGRSSW